MKNSTWIFGLLSICLAIAFPQQALSQIDGEDYNSTDKRVWIQLVDNPIEIDGVKVGPGQVIPCPLIYFRADTSQRRLLYCDVDVTDERKINLRNFRLKPDSDGPPDDLITGADPTDPLFPQIASGSSRTYYIQFESVLLKGASKAIPIRTSIKLGSNVGKPPTATLLDEDDKDDEIELFVRGLSIADFISSFKDNPSLIRIKYDLADDDPALDIETHATSIEASSRGTSAVLRPARKLPKRPVNYEVVVSVPWQTLRDKVRVDSADWAYPAKKDPNDDLVGSLARKKSLPSAPQRDNSSFAFEAAWNSIVKPSVGKRNNVGVFSLYLNPTIPLKFYGTGRNSNNPWWLSLDPILEADIDTQKIADSDSPNRILMGLDLNYGQELGFSKENGLVKRKGFIRRFIWKNGFRYDSDRDFKLQTMYFHTEFSPRFQGFEDDFARRFYRFKNDPKNSGKKEPFVSSYFFRPYFGYDLGGTIRRDDRDLTTPTEHISRGFVRLKGELELKRLFKFGFDNTYYYLQNAERRRNRNYLETYLEMNVGRLAKFDLSGWSNAVFFKFKGGEQPPDFGRVNSLSLGFKVFR